MSNKKFAAQDLEDTHGPMNRVAKEDAKVWASKVLPHPVGPISIMFDLDNSTSSSLET